MFLPSDIPTNTWYWSILPWGRSLSFWWMHGETFGWFHYVIPQAGCHIPLPDKSCIPQLCVWLVLCSSRLALRAEPDSGSLEGQTCGPSQVSVCLHRTKRHECAMAFSSLEMYCSSSSCCSVSGTCHPSSTTRFPPGDEQVPCSFLAN